MTASIMVNGQLWIWDSPNHRFYSKEQDGATSTVYRTLDDWKRIVW